MAIAVRNSMMTYQPSLEFQASLGLWRCFVVDMKGLDEFQLTLAELRSQPPVPPVGLPSLIGLPCLPPSSLVMPLVVKLYENREIVQGCGFWMAELLVQNRVIWTVWLFVQNRVMWTVWLFVLNCQTLADKLFVLKGAIWIVCLFVQVLKELGTESLVHYGYVATLSVLLFVSFSGLGFAFFWAWPFWMVQAFPCFCCEVRRSLLSVFFVDVRCDACGGFVFRFQEM